MKHDQKKEMIGVEMTSKTETEDCDETPYGNDNNLFRKYWTQKSLPDRKLKDAPTNERGKLQILSMIEKERQEENNRSQNKKRIGVERARRKTLGWTKQEREWIRSYKGKKGTTRDQRWHLKISRRSLAGHRPTTKVAGTYSILL